MNSEITESQNAVAHFCNEETPPDESIELSKVVEEDSNENCTATGTENS